jgi:hypothetical protein
LILALRVFYPSVFFEILLFVVVLRLVLFLEDLTDPLLLLVLPLMAELAARFGRSEGERNPTPAVADLA